MTWTVIVPFKTAGPWKTRLATALSPDGRGRLALEMFRHVTDTIDQAGADLIVLTPVPPPGRARRWHKDSGSGLNSELGILQHRLRGRWAVVNADLPLLRRSDLAELFDAAEQMGLALAADRNGDGTNAVAVADGRRVAFHFGAPSLTRFIADAGDRYRIVRVPGLQLDIDTEADLKSAARALRQRGCSGRLETAVAQAAQCAASGQMQQAAKTRR